MSYRDLVRFESNERVDLGDLQASQENARSETRLGWSWFLDDIASDPRAKFVAQGFAVTEDGGGPSAQVDISNGLAIGPIVRGDSTEESGVFFGQEGPTSQSLDFSGQPNNTYSIYIRASYDPGTINNRIFWNDNTEDEEVDSINTRFVFGWDVTFGTASPGDEWQKVAEVVWAGATIATGDITLTRNFLWEGGESGGFPYTWGGGSDRDNDRATYGVFTYKRWVNAMRTQIREITGLADWWLLPTADLAETRAHIDQTVDPHSASPSWTGTVSLADFTVSGQHNGTLVSDGFAYDAAEVFDERLNMVDLDQIIDSAAGAGAVTGSWTTPQGAGNASVVGFAGAAPLETPLAALLTGAVAGVDEIVIPINHYLRAGANLLSFSLIAEADAGDIDIEVEVFTQDWTGTGGTTLEDSDTQNIGNTGRKLATFDLSAYTPVGSGNAAGQKFTFMKIKIDTLNSGAADLLIYGGIFLFSTASVLNALNHNGT